jgi:tetratricopeptide (TPR) repeat protein
MCAMKRPYRRDFLRKLGMWSFVLASLLAGNAQAGFFDDAVSIRIKVEDENGQPIPYVTVWFALRVEKSHQQNIGIYQHVDVDDLWRITQRYGESHEIISQYGDKPLKGLEVSKMGNAMGIFQHPLDYAEETGKGNHYPRPDPLTFGYTFMKRGYFPAKADFTIPRSQDRVEATVTLKRNPAEPLELQPYLQTFARIRFEWSDIRKNKAMTQENRLRLEGLRSELEQAARQAIEAGDKAAAARIYARMRYVPRIIVINGQIAGYDQGDANTPEAKRALDLAYQLDPDNTFIWSRTFRLRARLPATATPEQKREPMLAEVEKLIAVKGVHAWPECYSYRAGVYGVKGDYEKSYRLYKEAERMEPKYTDWSKRIDELKREMKAKGLPVPSEW